MARERNKKKCWLELVIGIKDRNSTEGLKGNEKIWPQSSNMVFKCVQPVYHIVYSITEERIKSLL
jgi:hypothetical protein